MDNKISQHKKLEEMTLDELKRLERQKIEQKEKDRIIRFLRGQDEQFTL